MRENIFIHTYLFILVLFSKENECTFKLDIYYLAISYIKMHRMIFCLNCDKKKI